MPAGGRARRRAGGRRTAAGGPDRRAGCRPAARIRRPDGRACHASVAPPARPPDLQLRAVPSRERYRSRMPRILVAAVLAFAVLAVPASAAPKKGPGGAAFYKPPKHLKGKHGGLIWVHKQTGRDALKGARNELLLYRSKDLSGKVTAVSGSVAIPKGKAPKGGWPVITYAHGTTGAADACAPTKGYDKDDLTSYAFPLLHRWIKAGFAVVRTDYDGRGAPGVHQYLVGEHGVE